MIEDVEDVGSELQPDAFWSHWHRKSSSDRDIYVPEARPPEAVPAEVSDLAGRWVRECVHVEQLLPSRNIRWFGKNGARSGYEACAISQQLNAASGPLNIRIRMVRKAGSESRQLRELPVTRKAPQPPNFGE